MIIKVRQCSLETNSSSSHSLAVYGSLHSPAPLSEIGKIVDNILYIDEQSGLQLPIQQIDAALRKPLVIRFCEHWGLNGLAVQDNLLLIKKQNEWVYNENHSFDNNHLGAMGFKSLFPENPNEDDILQAYFQLMINSKSIRVLEAEDEITHNFRFDDFYQNEVACLQFWYREIPKAFNLSIEEFYKFLYCLSDTYDDDDMMDYHDFEKIYHHLINLKDPHSFRDFYSIPYEISYFSTDLPLYKEEGRFSYFRNFFDLHENYNKQTIIKMSLDEFIQKLWEIYLLPNNPFKIIDHEFLD